MTDLSESNAANVSNSARSPEGWVDEWEHLYNHAPWGYHSLDKRGVFIRINQTELAMLGYEREEIIGQKSFLDLLTPESQATFHENFPNLQQQGWIRDVEFWMIRRDATVLPVSLSATAIQDEAGNYLMSHSIVLDITARKQLEVEHQHLEGDRQRLTQERERFLALASDLQVITNQNGYFQWVSPSFEAVLGWTPTEMTSRPWIEFVHPDDMNPSAAETTHLLAGRKTFAFENRYRHKDGSYRWFLWKAQSDVEEQIIYGAAIDISDRKATEMQLRLTESRLRDLLSANPAVLYACQASGNYAATFVSENVTAMLGYSSQAFVENSQFWATHIHPDDAPRVFNDLSDLFVHNSHTHDYRFLHQDGTYRWVSDECKLIRDADGTPLEIVGYWSDITEKKQLEAQFLRAQRLESLGTLASGIAHDLNNVLTPIIGIVQLLPLKIPDLDPQTQRLLQLLQESTRRGADLVKQILSFTRGIEGKQTNTQLGRILQEIYAVLRQTFPKNIEINSEIPGDLWLIPADATLLHQVFMNLCVNARDAMPQGGTLSMSAENLVIDDNYAQMNLDAQPGFYVAVTIADTGMGIPADILDRIFDPFFTTKDVGHGTGLGLATVLGIVKSHRGFVNVYSELNRGSRFKIYLPATTASEIEMRAEADIRLGQGQLILVVDDEVAIQEITQATLETHGYRVLTAKDGIEAIALYAEHKSEISVILLDLMMPALDSVTTIRTLCRLKAEVKIVAMSGLATNESVTRTMSEGVQGFLAKPFTAPELLNLLAQLC